MELSCAAQEGSGKSGKSGSGSGSGKSGKSGSPSNGDASTYCGKASKGGSGSGSAKSGKSEDGAEPGVYGSGSGSAKSSKGGSGSGKSGKSTTVLLETVDLKNCSPATISRCAMIYLRDQTLPRKS